MAEEIDDNDFYRENFSADSDWEVFNAQLGEILQKWDVSAESDVGRSLKAEEIYTCKWKVKSETLDMLKNGISVEYHQAILKDEELSKEQIKENNCLQRTNCHHDLISSINSFGPPIRSSQDLHILARIYGLRRFIVLHPVNPNLNYMKSTSEFNFFLSAIAVVSAEVQSVVPIFVQIYDPKWNFYTGVALAPALRTNFRLIGLEKAPPECRYLMGLLTLFREKVPTSYPQAAMISVCTTYALDTMRIRMPMYVPFDHGLSSEDIVVEGVVAPLEVQQFYALPHGYTPESCTEIYLVYTWPELSEHVAFDSEQRSDFVPSKAPLGKVYLSVEASSYLSCCLRDYQSVAEVTRSLESFVGRNFSGTSSGAEAGSNPLDRITEHKLTQRRDRNYELPSQAGLTKRLPGPMTESELSELLAYLFPDMHPQMALFPYNKKSFKDKFDPMRIKSAVPDSLACRLSCLLATCHAHLGSVEGMAQVWAAFTRQLRLLWDNCLTVPGISSGFPDTRTCLLHQKLQMLNVCVERRVQREANSKRKSEGMARKASSFDAEEEEDDEDDDEGEFFDCDDLTAGAGSPTKAVLSMKPEGRLRRLNDERLLEEPEEYLYIPETQDPVPKTEDQLQDDAEVMLKLGPGSGLTTQMMCTSLLSDMEAFKAANPRGTMEDFIRWYSPKDWEEVTDELGQVTHQLSIRMTTEGNTWQKVWEQAQAVPVSRQRRLFDDTNEALKVLHYMETRKMHEIYNLTIIPLLHSAILKLIDILSNAKVEDLFSPQIEQLLTDLCRLSRSHSDQLPSFKPLLDDLAELERRFYQYKCFERLSGYPQKSSLQQVKLQFEEILRKENCCTIVNRRLTAAGDGTLYDILIPKLEEDMSDRLISKDYIIRLDGDTKSTEKGLYLGPQFMRAIVTGEKLRLCGAFTESTAFV
ncbi:LOW QUALITY PROTEIN: rab3 GTPase-activating protein catalytic subunit [Drosophila eugracilis]|uniref:LOW QUALITY PROTEIN: rab3 GTPase-activating protein catalytic subunit n=1 Tax=Drosophila eugracilis TaxID=29029 RepID=UPI001BDAC48D|nr:LOW QUALITY PROTEIN: rab3 GTPase-activating protein catalytic subunit [Drosophila eugracilis]